MSDFSKSTIALHHEEDRIIIHRSGRGFFGNVKTWNGFYDDQQQDLRQEQNQQQSAIINERTAVISSKTFTPSKSFAILQLSRHPFLWHVLLPLVFIIISIAFIAKNASTDDQNNSASNRIFQTIFAYYNVSSKTFIYNEKNNRLSQVVDDSIENSGSPIWTSSGVTALLILVSFGTVTIIPQLISPFLFSEPGRRSDLILPIDVQLAVNNNKNKQENPSSSAATSPQNQQHHHHPSFSSVTFDDQHCPFRRVPLTPKSVGFFIAILVHPISHFILLFTNAFVKESFFYSEVQDMSKNFTVQVDNGSNNFTFVPSFYSSSSASSSKQFSPFSFVASWITVDFVKSMINPSFIQESPEAACGLGRFWFWFVVPLVLLGLFGVVLGVFWSPTQMQIEKHGGEFKQMGQWIWGWSAGLSLFPIFFRVLFTGFSCYQTASMFSYFSSMTNDDEHENSYNLTAMMIKNQTEGFLVVGYKKIQSIPVSALCPTCRCDVDSSESAGHTGTVVIAFIFLILLLPLSLNLHTQLRRLSGVPYLMHHEKVKPLPRTAGLHLAVFIMSRFLVPAFSGVLGNLISLGLLALFLDLLAVWFIWRDPNVSNVEVINFWFRRWTIPAAFSSSVLFCLWIGLVYQHDPERMRTDSNFANGVKAMSVIIEIAAVFIPTIIFILAYRAFKTNFRTKKNEETGTIEILSNLHAMFHYREILAVSPSRKTKTSRGAVGTAVQSSKTYSPKNKDDDDDDDYGHDSEGDDEDDDGEKKLAEGQQLVLQDEASSLALFPPSEDVTAESVLADVSRHVSF